MRYFALCLAFISCSLLGIILGAQIKRRSLYIQELINGLNVLKIRIDLSHDNLSNCFLYVKKECNYPASTIFGEAANNLKKGHNASQALSLAINNLNCVSLKKHDIDIVLQLCNNIGKLDITNQKKVIDLTISQLTMNLSTSKSNGNRSKLYVSLGFLSGLAIVVIFI